MTDAPLLDGPGTEVADPRELLLGYLDWYRDALLRKVEGLSEHELRTPLAPLTWAPLGLVRHLGWVERRWIRWGFAAQDIAAHPPGGREAEFVVAPAESVEQILSDYRAEVAQSRAVMAAAALTDVSQLGGRFTSAEQAPPLARILFHLLQEYARHVGQLDVVRELLDGSTGE